MIIDDDDLELLAWMTLGFDEESAIEFINSRYDRDAEFKYDIEENIERKFGCSYHQFCELIEILLPMTPLAESPLTGQKYHAFMDREGCAIVKIEA